MPALPLVPGTVRIGLVFADAVRQFGSRFYYSYSGSAPDSTGCAAAAATIFTACTSQIINLAPSAISLVAVNVQDLSSSTPGVGVQTGSSVGSRSGTPLPVNSAVSVVFKIPYVYRGGKPKIFLPIGVQGDTVSDSQWSPTWITTVNSAWGGFTAAINGAAMGSATLGQHVSVAYYHGYNKTTPPWRGPGFKYPPMVQDPPQVYKVSSHATATRIGSQRRRLNP